MKSAKGFDSFIALLALLGLAAAFSANGCVANTDPSSSDGDPGQVGASPLPEVAGDNVMTVTVNGSLCSAQPSSQYANEPCVSVTLCPAGSTTGCQTIDNVLLDTGSYGLRLFKSLVNVKSQPVAVTGGDLAECVQFGDGSSQWGPVSTVSVKLGNEPTVQVPIMLIESSYATPPGPCSAGQSRPDTTPAQAGFNGILGVGLFASDCGTACESDALNGEYYACSGSTCIPSAARVSDQQVRNPVASLPHDNNGVILRLPSVPAGGLASLQGLLILGIGTQANNQPADVTVYGADEAANFTTVFADYSATPIMSFIDSGSSVLFFPPPTDASLLPDCNSALGGSHGSGYAGFYCPSVTRDLEATNMSADSSISGSSSFQISNGFQLLSSGKKVLGTIADSSNVGQSAVFDWGLPFFYGRDVYVGFDGVDKTIGSKTYNGPLWAY